MGLVKVWTEGKQIEIDRDRIIWTDRSRIEQRKDCEQKWVYNYVAGPEGRGVTSTFESEDLVTGRAVHAGLEQMVRKASDPEYTEADYPEHAASIVMGSFERGELLIQGDEALTTIVPEIAETLALEHAWLAYAFVWIFQRRHLGPLLEKYEVLGLEEEIAWLLGEDNAHDNYNDMIIVMSRLDGVVRSREDGKLYILEYKTSKEFDDQKLEEIQIDEQGAAQSLAAYHRYGEWPAGLLYYYFKKGEKRAPTKKQIEEDPELIPYKRYSNSLVRPYSNWNGQGLPEPSNFKWTFNKPDGTYGRATKGWKRIDVWDSPVGVEGWLEMLDAGEIQPDYERDWLKELVAQPEIVKWSPERLERWRRGVLQTERRFAGLGKDYEPERRHRACFSFRTKCFMYEACHGSKTVEDMLIEGRLQSRVANHPIEYREEISE
jgi:PD-(D/E)XK nuclease superfamily protein